MATAWGASTWGSGTWGGPDQLTGRAASGAVGSLTASITIEIGVSRFLLEDGSGYLLLEDGSYLLEEAGTGPTPIINGAVGSVTETVTKALTGVVSTGAVNKPEVSSTIALVRSWGSDAWGSGVWGGALSAATGNVGSVTEDISVALTGVTSLGAEGTLRKNNLIRKALTGVAASGAVDSVAENISVALTGNSASGAVEFVTETSSVALAGISASGNLGGVAVESSIPLVSAWGSRGWGLGTWGGGIAGAYGQVGQVVYAPQITGVEASGSVGQLGFSKTFALTGVASTGAVNKPEVSSTVALVRSWGSDAWGSGTWGGGVAGATGEVGQVVYAPQIEGVEASGSVGQLTPSITIEIGVSRFLLEDGSGYLLLEDGSYLLEEAGTGPTPSIKGSIGNVAVESSIPLVSAWGSRDWGVGAWGGATSATIGTVGQVVYAPQITGVEASGSVGTLGTDKTFALTGVASTGAVNKPEVSSTVALVRSWGSDAWGVGAWGGSTTAATGEVGQVVYAPQITGVEASGEVGQLGFSKTFALTGVASTGAVNKPEVSSTVALVRSWGSDAWGAGAWGGGSGVYAVGEVSGFIPKLVGVSATGSTGSLGNNRTVALTGVTSEAAAGYIASVEALVIQGVQATGSVGVLGVVKSYWDIIDDAQNADWTVIPDGQTPNWGGVDNAQNSGWVVIPDSQTPGWTGLDNSQTAGWQPVVDTQTPNWSTLSSAQSANWGPVPNTQAAGWTQVSDAQTADWQPTGTTQNPNWDDVDTEQAEDWQEVTT